MSLRRYQATNKSRNAAQGLFSNVPTMNAPRSRFPRSHGHKTTFDGGFLIPVLRDEILPGDTIKLGTTMFCRMATLLRPFMDNVYLDFHVWFVPFRLVFSEWQKLNGERENPDDDPSTVLMPVMNSGPSGYSVGSLHDYLGLPVERPNVEHHACYHRAYNLIYREFYRDQNLIDSPVVDTGVAASDPADHVLRRRGKRHDYFTACLPWPQKGPDVNLPLAGQAPLVGGEIVTRTGSGDPRFGSAFGAPTAQPLEVEGTGANQSVVIDATTFNTGALQYISGLEVDFTNSTAYADLAQASAATLQELRQAIAVQHQYERDARAGTRYVERLYSDWNVTSPDFRLQRPEYLGGSSFPIMVNAIPNTAGEATKTQGELAAQALGNHQSRPITKSFTEHGMLLGIVSTRTDYHYHQGLHRDFSRSTRWDFALPAFANVSEQAVLNKEIFHDDADGENDNVFGYIPRYDEYRHKPSQVSGLFRGDASAPLLEWHLAEDFDNRPTLSQEFIEEDPPFDRVISVQTEPQFYFDAWFQYDCVRRLPMAGVPGLGRI